MIDVRRKHVLYVCLTCVMSALSFCHKRTCVMSLYDVLLICLISYICFDMCSISMMFGVSLYNKLMSEVSAHCVLQNTRRHLPLEALCGHVFLTCLMSGESFYSPSFDTNVTSGVLLRKAFLHLATVFCLQLAFHKHIFVRWWS